jgi:putative transposase
MRYRFIEAHQTMFPVIRMCKLLDVSPSGYYAWRGRPASQREMANQELVERIKAVHRKSHGIYGSPRVYRELKKLGMGCSLNRVARLMRRNGIRGRRPKRYRITTRRDLRHAVAENRLQRDFQADKPNQKWVADITYIGTEEGWLYLAAILDLYSRRIVGWSMSDRLTKALTIDALTMALSQRQPGSDLIHHSDQGSQYTDGTYQELLKVHGIQVSMNRAGNWYDNASMESFFGTLKWEWVYHQVYLSRRQARTDLFHYIEVFYNRERSHSALGYVSPAVYEQLYSQGQLCGLTPCPQN